MKTQHLLFCLVGAIVLSEVAYAEVNVGKQIPSVNQVIDALNPDAQQADDANNEGGAKTRSIDMSKLNPASTTKKKTKSKKPALATSSSTEKSAALSMEIIFGYNSAELTPAAKAQLKPVGEALASGKLANLSFVVEGHTDAIGGDSYNKTLSEQRAASVKSFLVSTFNLPSTQIQIVGKGKSDLLDPRNPESEVNRRVRIIAIK
jgi:outer membrane protein OmpA-like peptidoglycan-associated protein